VTALFQHFRRAVGIHVGLTSRSARLTFLRASPSGPWVQAHPRSIAIHDRTVINPSPCLQ
jgi:hypothetical protein